VIDAAMAARGVGSTLSRCPSASVSTAFGFEPANKPAQYSPRSPRPSLSLSATDALAPKRCSSVGIRLSAVAIPSASASSISM